MQILNLKINNFRGIKEFDYSFDDSKIICFVGRGDSCKTTIIQAINFVLYPQRWLNISDYDFYNGNVDDPIRIEATIGNFDNDLFKDLCKDGSSYGGYLYKWNKETRVAVDVWNEGKEDEVSDCCLKILFSVDKNLEPLWEVLSSNGTDSKMMNVSDRAKFNAFMIEDYQDKHLTMGKGSPLMNLYKSRSDDLFKDDATLQQMIRDIQKNIDYENDKIFGKSFLDFCRGLKGNLIKYNTNLEEINPSLLIRNFYTNNDFILRDKNSPLQMKGKGTKRLSSIGIQSQLANNIMLIDEIEQGLEPDRVKSLIDTLKKDIEGNKSVGQIFFTTHSRDVVVECSSSDIYIIRSEEGKINCLQAKKIHQGAIRKNPEGLFSKKILICEGPTECGIMKSFENFTYCKNREKFSYIGVVIADGGGSNFYNYAETFNELGYSTCIFCDSDVNGDVIKKQGLRDLGVDIVDWDSSFCLEMVIAEEIPWLKLLEIVKLAMEYKGKESIYDSIKVGQGELDEDIGKWTDSLELRKTIGQKMKNNDWFKTHTKGEDLGNILFSFFDDMLVGSQIKRNINKLSAWFDK